MTTHHHQTHTDDAPFLVLYNHRHSRQPARPRLPRPLKNTTPSHSIILTRKMAAKLENRLGCGGAQGGAAVLVKEQPEESTEVKNFFTALDLERGIPMQDRHDQDILYNFNEMSLSQSHSRLDKILFGLCSEMEEEPQAPLFT